MSGGKSKSVTVGYWYKLLLHFGLCRGPIDAFLEFRGGDRPAWQGEMTASGSINIDQPGLWGGESSEGGIQGTCEVMFGDAAQQPNTYLASTQGVDQCAYRGKATVVYHGRYGAGNPYPKPAAFLIRRIKKGWDNEVCWYVGTAEIKLSSNVDTRNPIVEGALDLTSVGDWISTEGAGLPDQDILISFNGVTFGGAWIKQPSVYRSARVGVADRVSTSFTVGQPQSVYLRDAPRIVLSADTRINSRLQGLFELITYIDDTKRMWITAFGFTADLSDNNGPVYFDVMYTVTASVSTDSVVTIKLSRDGQEVHTAQGSGSRLSDTEVLARPAYLHITGHNCRTPLTVQNFNFQATSDPVDLLGINPAHILYDSLTASDMMGEPIGLINEASFRAAAETLFTEGFGLCTTYDATSESITDFQKRICNVIGASLSRSRVNGQWYLDLLRADYVLADLPILTDDDILEWSAQPGTLDSAVNQVTVEWFDPVKKETRTTAPCQALGLIQAFGGIKSDASTYPEIPAETLALRCAARDLRNKATPVTRFELKTTRTPYAWRPGTCFRLQAPKRGIADMVCRVGEIDTGTIRQGAITLTAVQDVFGLPATVYVQPEPGINTNAPRTPVATPAQRAIEAPYTELIQRLSQADRDYLAADAGYLLVLAAQPAQSLNYALATAASGEDYAQRGSGDWCPTALITPAAGYLDTALAFTTGSLLDRVAVGSAALWDDEIVRVDALDTAAGIVTLTRGCADTVPAKHAAGSRIWFYDAAAASDYREYATGETVSAKCLTRTGGAMLPLASAVASTVVMDARWIRPYPPANATFNGETDPATLHGQIVLVWTQRNRITQADKLIDATVASLTPEVGTTYVARLLRADNSTVLDSVSGITGTTVTLSAAYSGQVVVELWSERDGYASLQRVRRTVAYTPGEFTRITEDGETRVTESGDARITE